MISYEDDDYIEFNATPEVIAAFEAEKLFFSKAGQPFPHERIIFFKHIAPERYAMFPMLSLFDCGAFSYSETSGRRPIEAKVGRYCSIAEGVKTFGARHPSEWATQSPITYHFGSAQGYSGFNAAHRDLMGDRFQRNEPVDVEKPMPVIEHDVWIGQHVQLARGIRIGTGSVIAAGSVVIRDVAPYTIVGGVPARKIRPRFAGDIGDRLLATEWWRYHPRAIFELDYTDPAGFADRFATAKAAGELETFDPGHVVWTDVLRRLTRYDVLETRRGGAGENFLGEGWSGPEDEFTWALGRSSTLHIPAEVVRGANRLDLALMTVPTRPQRLIVTIGTGDRRRQFLDCTVSGHTSVWMHLDEHFDGDGGLSIEIEHPDFTRPCDHGSPGDERELSIALKSVTLR